MGPGEYTTPMPWRALTRPCYSLSSGLAAASWLAEWGRLTGGRAESTIFHVAVDRGPQAKAQGARVAVLPE